MKQKIEIIMESDKNKGDIKLLHNGQQVRNLFGFNMAFNSRTNEISFMGKRLATDRFGQYFVDEQTKETAVEDINLLTFFTDEYITREKITNAMKEVEWAMKNIRDTTLFNARKMIERRLAS